MEGQDLESWYSNSPTKALKTVFSRAYLVALEVFSYSKMVWETPDNVKDYLDWLGIELGVKTIGGLVQIYNEDFKKHGGSELMGSTLGILRHEFFKLSTHNTNHHTKLSTPQDTFAHS